MKSKSKISPGKFVDSYWPLPNHVNPRDILQGNRTDEKIVEEFKNLQLKHGHDVMDKYLDKCARYLNPDRSDRDTIDFLSFLYEHDLTRDVDPTETIRAREGLKITLKHLNKINQSYTLADLGCGDGRMVVGLAAYLENLRKAYAVDRIPTAIDRLNENIQRLSPNYQKIVQSKVEGLVGNFLDNVDPNLEEKLKQTDILLYAFGPLSVDELIFSDSFNGYFGERSKLITCMPIFDHHNISGQDFDELERVYIHNLNSIGLKPHFYFERVGNNLYAPEEKILVLEGTKV